MLFRAQKLYLFCLHFINNVTIYVCTFDGVLDWLLKLLTTYTHDT
jgi:hypothetical protein